MILEFIISQWKIVAIAILTGSLSLMTHLWRNAEDGKQTLEIEFRLKVAAAEKATQEVKDRSTKTLETINADHQALLESAKNNAVANYLRANPRAVLGNPAACACPGSGSLRLPNLPATSSVAGTPDCAKPSDAVSAECLPPADFIKSCASDALQVTEWARWARMNHLPVEGE